MRSAPRCVCAESARNCLSSCITAFANFSKRCDANCDSQRATRRLQLVTKFDYLVSQLQGKPFLTGETFTVADSCAFPLNGCAGVRSVAQTHDALSRAPPRCCNRPGRLQTCTSCSAGRSAPPSQRSSSRSTSVSAPSPSSWRRTRRWQRRRTPATKRAAAPRAAARLDSPVSRRGLLFAQARRTAACGRSLRRTLR